MQHEAHKTPTYLKLLENGRIGYKFTRHTGVCQHVKGYPQGTREMNLSTGACPPCNAPMQHMGETYRPFAPLTDLIDTPIEKWPKMVVHGAR